MQRLALVVVLLGSGCGGQATAPTTAPPRDEPPAVVTLKALQNGDRACYVIVESDHGEQSIAGSFELCPGGAQDATALIGKPIRFTTERANVAAASCEGNPECSDSDEVDLVTSISAAP